jgi:hypothetical protein
MYFVLGMIDVSTPMDMVKSWRMSFKWFKREENAALG